MKLKRHRRFHAEVSTSSLNDIMFMLLLFFLIISTVANPNVIKILLPKSGASQAIHKKQITLTITAEKEFFIDKKPVPYDFLEAGLVEATRGIIEPTIILRVDSRLNVQDMVDVLELGTRLKIKMVLATEK